MVGSWPDTGLDDVAGDGVDRRRRHRFRLGLEIDVQAVAAQGEPG
jgi:hypothetical protein